MNEQEFWSILHDVPEVKPVLFRLYYDEKGYPIEYRQEERPGNYIDLDPETFRLQPRGARVVNGQLTTVDLASKTRKLQPNEHGTSCSPQDVCVIINKEPSIKWSLKTYEPD